MNAKAKGTRNEHRSMKLLEVAGYSVTLGSGLSSKLATGQGITGRGRSVSGWLFERRFGSANDRND